MPYIASERLYLTADKSAVVREGDTRAAFLFAIPGRKVPDADAERYGLTASAEPKPEPESKQAEQVENKAAEPEGNKSGSGLKVTRGKPRKADA